MERLVKKDAGGILEALSQHEPIAESLWLPLATISLPKD
jgi:hypothetical protein